MPLIYGWAAGSVTCVKDRRGLPAGGRDIDPPATLRPRVSFCRRERSTLEDIPNPLQDAQDRDPTPDACVSRGDSVAGKALVQQKASNGLFCEALCDQRALQMGSGKREAGSEYQMPQVDRTTAVIAALAQADDFSVGGAF